MSKALGPKGVRARLIAGFQLPALGPAPPRGRGGAAGWIWQAGTVALRERARDVETPGWQRRPSSITLSHEGAGPMDMTNPVKPGELAPALRSWLVQPRRIGSRTYQGACVIGRIRSTTYQRQSTTFGRTAGVFGLSSDGKGFVTGGGGFVDTVHEGIVSVILEDEDGRHSNLDLPAATALLEGGVARIDSIDSHPVAVTNMTGRQEPVMLLGPSAFIDEVAFAPRHGVLLIAALLSLGQVAYHPLGATAFAIAFGAAPLLRLRCMAMMRRNRASLGRYIGEVMS